jgi:hypothetical protein
MRTKRKTLVLKKWIGRQRMAPVTLVNGFRGVGVGDLVIGNPIGDLEVPSLIKPLG